MHVRKFFCISSEAKRNWANLRSAIESGEIRAWLKTVSRVIGDLCTSGNHFMLPSGQFTKPEIAPYRIEETCVFNENPYENLKLFLVNYTI